MARNLLDHGDGDIHAIFSSLGDPLNRFVLNTGGTDFKKNIVLAFTSDKKTNKAIRAAARGAGFPERVFNTYVIPSSLLKTNDALDETTDHLVIGQRTALWRDSTRDGGGYLDNPGIVVFRVTPPNESHDPLPTPSQMVRSTGRTEFDPGPVVDRLRQAIVERYPHLSAQELTTSQWIMQIHSDSPRFLLSVAHSKGPTEPICDHRSESSDEKSLTQKTLRNDFIIAVQRDCDGKK